MMSTEKLQQRLAVEDLLAIAAAEGADEVLMLREMVSALAGSFASEKAWKDAVCSKGMSALLEGVTRYVDETDSYMVRIPAATEGAK